MFIKQCFLRNIFVLVILCLGVSCKGKEEHLPEHNMMLTMSYGPSLTTK